MIHKPVPGRPGFLLELARGGKLYCTGGISRFQRPGFFHVLNTAIASRATVMRFGAFGDMIMLTPMLRWIAGHTGAPVDVVSSGGWTRPLLGMQPYVGELTLVTSRKAPYWLNRSQQDLVRHLAAHSQGDLLVCETDSKSMALARRARPDQRHLHSCAQFQRRPQEHWIEFLLRFAHHVYGVAFDPAWVRDWLRSGWLELDAAHVDECGRWLAGRGWAQRKLVLIQAGSKRTMRRGAAHRASNVKFWPDEHWVALCRHVLDADPEVQVLFCGSPQEHDYALRLAAAIDHPRVASVADELPIPRLLALQQRAHSMVSVDTGPAHAAAAMGCPLVVLFGDLDPREWQPYSVCAPVQVVQAGGAASVRDIALNEVIKAWSGLV